MTKVIQFPKTEDKHLDDFSERMVRIRKSLERINELMKELKETDK